MLSILFNIHFLLGLLIVCLLASFAYFYFTQKLDEQNEKINAMSLVVRAVAEELTYLRANVPAPVMGGGASNAQVKELRMPSPPDLAKDEVYSQGLQLIPVSDDEESDDDSEEDYSSNDEEDGLESGSDDGSDYGSVEEEDNSKHIKALNEVEEIGGTCPVKGVWEGFFKGGSKDIKEENKHDEVILPSSENGEAMTFSLLDVTKGMLEVDMNSVNELIDVSELLNKEATSAIEEMSNVKKVEMTVDEQSIDYKKMPLSKLRAIAVEKKLCEDASKMKKQELFKLLNVEHLVA
jgi:hypothetical protein